MRFRVPMIVVAALAVVAFSVGTAFAAHSAVFKGSYSGTATEKVDGQTVTAVAKGKGTGTLLGKGSISGTVVANTANPPCGPFSGPGVIAGVKGKLKVRVLPSSRGCAAGQDDQNNISLSGNATVKGGTGKFLKARGTLHFSGHYDRSTGAFTVKLTGTLKY